MTIEEIRKGAPDGATHYSLKFGYIKKSYNNFMMWTGRDFVYFYMPIGQYFNL